MKKILFALFALITTISFSQKSVLLRYKYKEGDVYKQNITLHQKIDTIMTLDMSMNMSMHIKTANKKGFSSLMSFGQVTMDMAANGQNMKYDSNTDEATMDPFAKGVHSSMKALLESTVLFDYDKIGNIKNATIQSGNPDIQQFKENMNSMTFPTEKVSVGSEWKFSKTTKEGFTLNVTYKVTSIKSGKVNVDLSGEIPNFNGVISGTGCIDVKTGNIDSMIMLMNMAVQGQKIDMKISTTIEKQ